jgi:hypothetical protein
MLMLPKLLICRPWGALPVDVTAKAALEVDGAVYEMGALLVTIVNAPEGGALAVTETPVGIRSFEHDQPLACWLHAMACALAACGNASADNAPTNAAISGVWRGKWGVAVLACLFECPATRCGNLLSP